MAAAIAATIMTSRYPKTTSRRRTRTAIDRHSLRVLVMGAKGVGKTSIIRGFVKQHHAEIYKSCSFAQNHSIEIDKVVTELVDTKGFLLPSLKKMAIRTSDAFVLVYAVDDQRSFEEVVQLREEILEIMGQNVPIVVVGNKVDVEKREVNATLADCVISIDWGCPYIETSAKNALKLQNVFRTLFRHPCLYSKVDILLKHMREERRQSLDCSKRLVTNVTCTTASSISQPKRKRTLSWQTIRKIFKD